MGNETKDMIINQLMKTDRAGIELLIKAMEQGGFFKAPCSSDKHLCKPGGLAQHSLNVCQAMLDIDRGLNAGIPLNSIIICGILHDLGKMGDHGKPYYEENILKDGKQSKAKPFATNKELIYLPHEVRSAIIAERYIELTEDEETAILWHNGLYGTFKYDIQGKETPLYMVLHWADMWASRVIEIEDKEEG